MQNIFDKPELKTGKVKVTSQKIAVKVENEGIIFEPYYVQKFDEEFDDFHVGVYDKTHLGTNLRKCLCLDKVKSAISYC